MIDETCLFIDANLQSLFRKVRHENSSLAKSLVCYWGTEVLGFTARDVAARLQMSYPAVSYRSKVGREYCEENQLEFSALRR